MTVASVAQNRGLGGIGGPEELLRELTLDGVVVLASAAPCDLAATVRMLCLEKGWAEVWTLGPVDCLSTMCRGWRPDCRCDFEYNKKSFIFNDLDIYSLAMSRHISRFRITSL